MKLSNNKLKNLLDNLQSIYKPQILWRGKVKNCSHVTFLTPLDLLLWHLCKIAWLKAISHSVV